MSSLYLKVFFINHCYIFHACRMIGIYSHYCTLQDCGDFMENLTVCKVELGIKPCRCRPRASVNVKFEHQDGGCVTWLLVTDGLI